MLYGKTGSGVADETPESAPARRWHGWFVGHVARGDRRYVFVTHYVDRAPTREPRPRGWIARDIARSLLARLGAD